MHMLEVGGQHCLDMRRQMGCEYGEHGQRQMKARTNWKQDEKVGGCECTNKDEGESIHAQTRDEQTKRAVSMKNMDEEGQKPTLTGEEEMSW